MRAVLTIVVAMTVGCTSAVRVVEDDDASVSASRPDAGDSAAPSRDDASDGDVATVDASDAATPDAAVPPGWCSLMLATPAPVSLGIVTSGDAYDCRAECGGTAGKALRNTFSDSSVRANIPPGRAPGCKYVGSSPNLWCCPATTCVGGNGGGRCGAEKYYNCEGGGVMSVTANCRQLQPGSNLEWCCDDTKPY